MENDKEEWILGRLIGPKNRAKYPYIYFVKSKSRKIERLIIPVVDETKDLVEFIKKHGTFAVYMHKKGKKLMLKVPETAEEKAHQRVLHFLKNRNAYYITITPIATNAKFIDKEKLDYTIDPEGKRVIFYPRESQP